MKLFYHSVFPKIFFTTLIFLTLNCNKPQEIAEVQKFTKTDNHEILQLLDTQAKDWSNGDLEKFMEGYWKSDSLQFIGKTGINYGWQNAFDNYRKNYPDTAAMGKLRFEVLKLNPISSDAVYLTGKFFLKRTTGDLDGIFTLVFRKIDGRWLCIYDHTS